MEREPQATEAPERHPTQDLDDVVHQRVRLGIMAVLEEAGRADFNYLASTLELTNGNLSRHLRVLEDAGLLQMDKQIDGRRVRSWLALTPRGRTALKAELQALRLILNKITIP